MGMGHTQSRLDTPVLKKAEWTRTRGMRRMRAALQASFLFPALSSFCRLTVRDRDVLHDLDGAAVFVSNHVSALDAVVMTEALPPRYRHRSVVVAAADSIFKRKWEARLAQVTVGAFPIPRGGGARPHLEYLKELLEKKWSVIIFPEGRLTSDGNMGQFRGGIMRILQDTPVPVVPLALSGLWRSLFARNPDKLRHARHLFPRIRLAVGAPVAPSQVTP